MPINFNTDVVNVKSIEVFPQGYKTSLIIVYGFHRVSHQVFLVWKTTFMKTNFKIAMREVTKKYRDDYAAHFKDTLELFRKDLDEWIKIGLPEPYMKDYYEAFKDYIY